MTREEKFTEAVSIALNFLWNEHRRLCKHFESFLLDNEKYSDPDFSHKSIYFIKRITMIASMMRMYNNFFNKYAHTEMNHLPQDIALKESQETIELIKEFSATTNKEELLKEYIDALMAIKPYATSKTAKDDYYHIEKHHIRLIYELGESYLRACSSKKPRKNIRYLYIAVCGAYSVFYRAAVADLHLPTEHINTVKEVYNQVQVILSTQAKHDIEFVLGSLVKPIADA